MDSLIESVNILNESIDSLKRCALKSKIPLDKCDNNNEIVRFLKSGAGDMYTKSLTSDNNGVLMPNNVCTHVYDQMKEYSPIRSLASVIKISTDKLDVLLDTKIPEAAWATETAFPALADPEFKKVQIPVHEVFTRIKVTQKLLDDSDVDIYSWFISKIANQMSAVEDTAFLLGNGEGKPKGILAYPTRADKSEFGTFQHFATGVNGNFKENGADVLISAANSLKREFMKNAVWIMSRSAFSSIQKLKEPTLGRYIWQPSISATPSTLLGYPVIVDDNMPELNTNAPTVSIMFGDLSKAYQIVDRSDLQVFRDPYSSKPFVEFYATKRTGGDVINFDALKLIKFGE